MKLTPRTNNQNVAPRTPRIEAKKIVKKSDIEKLVEDSSPTKIRRIMNVHKLNNHNGKVCFSPRLLKTIATSPTQTSLGGYSTILSPKNRSQIRYETCNNTSKLRRLRSDDALLAQKNLRTLTPL